MCDHAVAVLVLPALTDVLFGNVSDHVHGRRVVPKEEWLVVGDLLLHPVDRSSSYLFVDCFHALLGERTGIFDFLLAYTSKPRILAWIINVRCGALKHSAGTELLPESWILWIVRIFRLLFCIQVIEVPKELVETVHCGKVFISVAEVVLTKLACGVTKWLQQFGYGWVLGLKSYVGAGHTDLRQTCANWVLTSDKARASRCAALLRVVVCEGHPFFCDPVDVRGSVAHHAATEVADVPDANVITPQDEYVRFLCCHIAPYLPFKCSSTRMIPRVR